MGMGSGRFSRDENGYGRVDSMRMVRLALIPSVLAAVGLCGWILCGGHFAVATQRMSYEESCRHLQQLGFLGPNEFPPLPARRPSNGDDQPLGLSFFRTFVGDAHLNNLTIPRTFFGRSEIRAVSFTNADLSESCLCWNDFIDVDFTNAVLTSSDLRASNYERAKFVGSDLRKADLRRSIFLECDFTKALLDGAKLDKGNKLLGIFSEQQKNVINYQPEGEEPPGG